MRKPPLQLLLRRSRPHTHPSGTRRRGPTRASHCFTPLRLRSHWGKRLPTPQAPSARTRAPPSAEPLCARHPQWRAPGHQRGPEWTRPSPAPSPRDVGATSTRHTQLVPLAVTALRPAPCPPPLVLFVWQRPPRFLNIHRAADAQAAGPGPSDGPESAVPREPGPECTLPRRVICGAPAACPPRVALKTFSPLTRHTVRQARTSRAFLGADDSKTQGP